MTNQITELVVGLFLPLVIALVTRPGMSDLAKNAIALAFCAVAGAVTTYLTTGGLNLNADLAGSVMTVTVSALTFYRNVWKPALDRHAATASSSSSSAGGEG